MLTSIKNPWVKHLRKLHQSKYRHETQEFLLEGTHVLQEAIAAHYPLRAVGATPEWVERYPSLWQQVQALGCAHQLVSAEVLAAIATTMTPDGVVAIAPFQAQPVATENPDSPPSLGVAVETLQDPGNAGTLIRTAVAVGCEAVWFSQDSVDLTHPKVLRASAGQWFRLSKHIPAHLPTALSTLQAKGCQILGTAAEGAVPYWHIDLTVPTVILLGNEGRGLSSEGRAIADHIISIPMAPAVESLNVSIAAAIVLFEAKRQRYMKTLASTTHPVGALP